MAPAKRTPTQKQGAKSVQATPATQRSISSFFSPKGTKTSPEGAPTKTELKIPSFQPPAKKTNAVTDVDAQEASRNTSTPKARAAMGSTGDRRNDRNGGAAAVPTPSPNEISSGRHIARSNDPREKGGRLSLGAQAEETKGSPAHAADLDQPPESLIGRRLKVYWPKDLSWYEGHIQSYSKRTRKHLIVYEDGEEEDLHLHQEKIQWLEQDITSPKQLRKKAEAQTSPAVKDTRASPRLSQGKAGTQTPPSKLAKSAENVADDEDESPILRRPKRANRRVLYTVESDSEVDDGDEDWAAGGEAKAAIATASEGEEDGSEEEMDLEVEDDEEMDLDEGSGGRRRGAKRAKSGGAAGGTKPAKRNRPSVASPQRAKQTPPHIANSASNVRPPPPAPPAGEVQVSTPEPTTAPPHNKAVTPSAWKTNGGGNVTPAGSSPLPPNGNDKKASHAAAGLEFELTGEAAERFGGRVAQKFQFLIKDRRDAKRRRPTDPGYDPSTLYCPDTFLKGLTGGQRQWWEIKSQHMDKVLLFKMGKFYEMFEMDSHVGARDLDLQYMKGEQPHCGFPEKNYSENAERLARKGHRVLVVEQTETPDQLEVRKRETGSKDKVVKRKVCAVITKGTLRDGDMLAASPEAAYLLSVVEREAPAVTAAAEGSETLAGSALIGVCVVDTATSRFMVGQFIDDIGRGRLRAVLSELRPVELVKPRGCLSDLTEAALRDHTRQPLINALPSDDFWAEDKVISELGTYFKGGASGSKAAPKEQDESAATGPASWPRTLRQLAQSGEGSAAALSALGGCLSYLRSAMMDTELVSCRRFELLPGSDAPGGEASPEDKGPASAADLEEEEEAYMLLDSAALENLEILENSKDGGTAGTLLAQLDHCVASFGRRLLRQWIVRPLYRKEAITARQNAVADLKGPAMEALGTARRLLSGIPDLERLLSRLYSNCGAGNGRNAENVVMYEDAARKRMKEFLDALRGCHTLLQAVHAFRPCLDQLTSTTLKQLVTPGQRFPDIAEAIRSFETAFDWAEAAKSGRVIPTPGVDEAFDEAAMAFATVEAELQSHLESVRKKLNCSEISYVNISKDPYQIEIPDRFHTKLPSDFELKTSRKGYNRYYTSRVKDLLAELAEATEAKESSHKGILRGLMVKFCASCPLWNAATACIAELDALGSLAMASSYAEGPMCRPSFTPPPTEEAAGGGSPDGEAAGGAAAGAPEWLHARNLRHPGLVGHLASSGTFVPNDTRLGGGGRAPFMLLTGPNMGGKSTLLRQICLAVIMAQVGADVSAEEFWLSPVDRVFVRMGARDQIMASQSTFLIELSETATMLRSATRHSLVALDELGRGTATSDGQAIAYAVLQHLAHITRCRGLFSTHYHRLADEHENDPEVALYHMACQVGKGPSGIEEVAFLYKLAEGACPKSYGINVARLSGMPESVMARAVARAAELEVIEGERHHRRCQNEPPKDCHVANIQDPAQAPADLPNEPDADAAQGMEVDASDLKVFDILKRLDKALGMEEEDVASGRGDQGNDGKSALIDLWQLAGSAF